MSATYICCMHVGRNWDNNGTYQSAQDAEREEQVIKSMARTTKSRFGLVEPLVSAEKAAHNLRGATIQGGEGEGGLHPLQQY